MTLSLSIHHHNHQQQQQHPAQPLPLPSPSLRSANRFRPRRSTSNTSLQHNNQPQPQSHSLKRLGSKLFHRKPSLSLSSNSTSTLTTTTFFSPPASERALSAAIQEPAQPQKQPSNYPQLLPHQPLNRSPSLLRSSCIIGLSHLSSKSLSSLSKLSPANNTPKHHDHHLQQPFIMDDDPDSFHSASQPSTPNLRAQHLSPLPSGLTSSPSTPSTPLEKPEFQTEYARSLFHGPADHRSYTPNEDEDEELAPASSGSDLEPSQNRPMLVSSTRHGSTSSLGRHNLHTSSSIASQDAASDQPRSPPLASHRPLSKSRSSGLVINPPSPHSHHSAAPSSHTPSFGLSLNSHSNRGPGRLSSLRKKIGYTILQKPSRIPIQDANCLVPPEESLVGSDSQRLNPSALIVPSARSRPPSILSCARSDNAALEPPRAAPATVNSRPLQRTLSLRTFPPSEAKPAGNLHGRGSNDHMSPSPTSTSNQQALSFKSRVDSARPGKDPFDSLAMVENEVLATSRSISVANHLRSQPPPSGARRMKPRRAPLQSLEQPDSLNYQSANASASPPPPSSTTDPSCQSSLGPHPTQPPARLDPPKRAPDPQPEPDPERTLEPDHEPDVSQTPQPHLSRRRSPIMHESANDVRRQIAREVNGHHGSAAAQRLCPEPRPPQSSTPPPSQGSSASGQGQQPLGPARVSRRKQLSVTDSQARPTQQSYQQQLQQQQRQQPQYQQQPQNQRSQQQQSLQQEQHHEQLKQQPSQQQRQQQSYHHHQQPQQQQQPPHQQQRHHQQQQHQQQQQQSQNHHYQQQRQQQQQHSHQQYQQFHQPNSFGQSAAADAAYDEPNDQMAPSASSSNARYQTPSVKLKISSSASSSTVQPRPRIEKRPQPPPPPPLQYDDDEESDDEDEVVCSAALRRAQPKQGSSKKALVYEDPDLGLAEPPRPSRKEESQQQISEPGHIAGNIITINGRTYTRQCVIGKGGSSKVFRAGAGGSDMVAIKLVGLKTADDQTFMTFCNEIELLERLRGHERIIGLIDSVVDHPRRKVWLVMELGETDLNQLLIKQSGKAISFRFIKHIWEQMLEAVHAVHEAGIIHTDLKPANFVLVQGCVKIIDFGIAKVVPADTTNISRETQIGTANYMSPEALMMQQSSHGGHQAVKMGRATDVWALGCILYQMIYGHTPFSRLETSIKVHTIRDPNHRIEYLPTNVPSRITEDGRRKMLPELTVAVEPAAIATMKGCLSYYKEDRPTIPALLKDEFLLGPATGQPINTRSSSNSKTFEIDSGTFESLIHRSWDWWTRRSSNGSKPTEAQKKKFINQLKESIHMSQ